MEHATIACCYHPTTIVCVDDDGHFLNSLKVEILNTCLGLPKLYSNPFKALQFFKQDYQAKPFTERCLLLPEGKHQNQRNIDINVRTIHQEVYNAERFNEISILIIDYAMPGMNGLELCQQLKGSHFKIILLTGEADEKLAIAAFNKGLIHKFIRKNATHFAEALKNAIDDLQQEYFQNLSEIVISSLTKNPEYAPNCLDDPVFINFFNELTKQHQFTEYYLLDALGSYLFLDFKGNQSWLLVKDEDAMEGAYFNAVNSDTPVADDILTALKTREKLLYLHDEADFAKNPNEWRDKLHPARKLEGKVTYYVAFIQKTKVYDINTDAMLSYKAFLDKL